MSCFCFQISPKIPHYISPHVSSVLTVNSFPTSFFMVVLNSNDKVLCRMFLNLVCLQFIPWLDGVMGFREHHTEAHFSSHRIREYKLSTDGLNLDSLVKVLFAWCLYLNNSTFSFSLYLFYSMEVSH